MRSFLSRRSLATSPKSKYAHSDPLTANEPLKFSVGSPALGLNDQQYDGVAGQSISIPIASLPEGDQTLVVRVQSAKGNDAVERHVKIYVSRFTKDEMIKTDLVPGATLPDIGSLAELTLIVTSQAQNKYLENVRTLSSPWSARAEARVAGNVARSLLKYFLCNRRSGKRISSPLSTIRRRDRDVTVLFIRCGAFGEGRSHLS